MVTEAKKDSIRKEARKLLDSFGKKLERVPAPKESSKVTSKGRVEGMGKVCDVDFRTRVLENAPKSDKDALVAEKANW